MFFLPFPLQKKKKKKKKSSYALSHIKSNIRNENNYFRIDESTILILYVAYIFATKSRHIISRAKYII